MRDTTIARNYAGALHELGQRHGEGEAYAASFESLAAALEGNPRVRRFLETPKVDQAAKQAAVRSALEGRVPERFLRFVLVVIDKGRQGLLSVIETEYRTILDEHAGRIRAQVTLAREPDAVLEQAIGERLTRLLGKDVEPRFSVNPALLGGLVVRWGDRVLDGSVRRQLVTLRRDMLKAGLPALPAASA